MSEQEKIAALISLAEWAGDELSVALGAKMVQATLGFTPQDANDYWRHLLQTTDRR